MRIAIVDPGGFSIPYDISLAAALGRAGYDVYFVSCRPPYEDVAWPEGVEYYEHYYKLSQRLRKRHAVPKVASNMLKGIEHITDSVRLLMMLRGRRPDVIHLQWLVLPLVDAVIVKRMRAIAPVVLTVHDTRPFHGHPSARVQLARFEETVGLFDAIIVHTEYSKRELMHNTRIDPGRIHVVDHGVLDYYRRFGGASCPTSKSRTHILCFGTLKPYKGLDVALRAIAALPPSVRRNVRLEVVGSPRMDVRPLRNLAANLGIQDQVVWDLRHVPEHEVATIFGRSTFVALPYRRIDQSGVLMLAIGMGRPVVASNIGGFPEVIEDGVHGFLVEPGDVEGLTNAFLKLIIDSGLRHRMSSAVRKLGSSRFGWDKIAECTGRVYEGVARR